MSSAIFYSGIPRGKCKKCGTEYFGWALIRPGAELICEKCGGNIVVVVIRKNWKEDDNDKQ